MLQPEQARPSHHPLKTCLGCGYVVNLWNRSGNAHTAHQAAEFLDETCRELPRALKVHRVLADSGFGDNDFLEHLESEGLRFIVAMRLSDYVKAAIRQVAEWTVVAPGIEMAEARQIYRHPRAKISSDCSCVPIIRAWYPSDQLTAWPR